jgi:hypothetical protein
VATTPKMRRSSAAGLTASTPGRFPPQAHDRRTAWRLVLAPPRQPRRRLAMSMSPRSKSLARRHPALRPPSAGSRRGPRPRPAPPRCSVP